MGKFTDYLVEKGKNVKYAGARYIGADLIKGFYGLGKDTVQEAIRVSRGLPENETNMTNGGQVDKDDIEKWLSNKNNGQKVTKPSVRQSGLTGEGYLRARESMGLKLDEVDKYYRNISFFCLLLLLPITYCIGGCIYYFISLGFKFWLLTYLVTAVLFFLMYLNASLDAACILHRRHIKGHEFISSPSMWIPRFKLPYEWRIKD